jgi:TatD DNase family protein
VIDSHCHLADDVFAADLDAVVDRALLAGLERVLVILEAGNAQESAQAERLHQAWPDVRVAVGVHPHGAHAFAGDPAQAGSIVREQIARTPYARAVGEIGLDYHYDFSPRDVQHAVFRAQLRVARELDLPVIIHTREADDDTLAILHEEGGSALRGVLHCFTGTPSLADAGLALGFFISLAGIITFPRAQELRDTVSRIPIERLLVETDSPFLAPVPHRGTRNEPAHVVRVAERLASERAMSVAELDAATTANFHTLFRP